MCCWFSFFSPLRMFFLFLEDLLKTYSYMRFNFFCWYVHWNESFDLKTVLSVNLRVWWLKINLYLYWESSVLPSQLDLVESLWYRNHFRSNWGLWDVLFMLYFEEKCSIKTLKKTWLWRWWELKIKKSKLKLTWVTKKRVHQMSTSSHNC